MRPGHTGVVEKDLLLVSFSPEHEMEIPWLITEPQFFALHTTDDFKAMVEKVGFPDFSIEN